MGTAPPSRGGAVLHSSHSVRDTGPDPFTDPLLLGPAPKTSFPQNQHDPDATYRLVHDELMLDGVARMNLATFCTTWEEPQGLRILAESFDKNIVDKDEYPQTAELESRCICMLADLWHAPEGTAAIGTSTTGSSEAAMLSGLAAKWRWRRRQEAAGKAAARPNLVCGPVQVCWEKFARYFDVEIREVPMQSDRWLMDPEQCLARCDENTILVVVTLGQTFTGLYEDVPGVHAALDALQERTGLDIDMHVDAASGGFLAPFCAPDLVWDFRLPRVRSINASGHKFGLAPLGSGWALWRRIEDLPEELVFDVNYLGGHVPTFNLNFSRPAGQVNAQYYAFVRLGRSGYAKVHRATYDVAQYLAQRIPAIGPFDVLFGGDPEQGLPAVTWCLHPGHVGYNLFDVAERVRSRGWLVPAYALPPDRQDLVVQRIIVRHGFSRDMGDMVLDDLRRSVTSLEDRPPSRSLQSDEGVSFNHDATARMS
jgi:glutamate decarboxylase